MNGTIRHRTCPAHETSDTDDSRTSVSHSTSSSPSVSSRLQHFMEGSPFALDNGSTSSLHATTSATKMIEWERRYYQKELPPFVEERGYPVRTNLPQSVLLIGESGEYTGVRLHIDFRDWNQDHIYFVSLVHGEERVLQLYTKVRPHRHFRVWLGHETGASDTILAYTRTKSGPRPPVNRTKRSATGSAIPESTGKAHHVDDAVVSLRRSKRDKPSEQGQLTAKRRRTSPGTLKQDESHMAGMRTQQVGEPARKSRASHQIPEGDTHNASVITRASETNKDLSSRCIHCGWIRTKDSTLQRDHLLKCVAYLADAKKKRPFQPPPPVAEQAIARPLYTETSSHLDAVTRLGEPTPREFLLRSKLDALSELGRRRELGLDEIESKIKTCDQLLEIEEGKPDIHAATSG